MKGGTYPEFIGQAGEHRVMSELLIRGISPFTSRLDHGIDMILINGKTIQVKTSKKHYNKATNGSCYHFQLTGKWIKTNGESKKRNSDKYDFLICWCIEDDVFYIIPSFEILDKKSVDLYPNTIGKSPFGKTAFTRDRSKWNIYKSRWELLTI